MIKNVFWELLFILHHNTKIENHTMKLRGNIFKTNKSEYFLMIPIIGLHNLVPKEMLKGKKHVRVKKKLYTYIDSKNSRVINVITKIIFWKRY